MKQEIVIRIQTLPRLAEGTVFKRQFVATTIQPGGWSARRVVVHSRGHKELTANE